MIPMRQVFIVSNEDNLQYPEGVACASVLEAGQEKSGSDNAMSVVKGALLGGAFKGLISFAGVLKGNLENAFLSGNRIFFFGADISPALLAVGFIVRLNVAVLIFIGGVIGWFLTGDISLGIWTVIGGCLMLVGAMMVKFEEANEQTIDESPS